MKTIEPPPPGVIDDSDTEEPDVEIPFSAKNLPEINGYKDVNFKTRKFFAFQYPLITECFRRKLIPFGKMRKL